MKIISLINGTIKSNSKMHQTASSLESELVFLLQSWKSLQITSAKIFLTQRSKVSKDCSKVLSFSVSEASRETCSPSASPASAVGFYPYAVPTPSKVHPLPVAVCMLLLLQPVSAVCAGCVSSLLLFGGERDAPRLLCPFCSWTNRTARGSVLSGSFRFQCLSE